MNKAWNRINLGLILLFLSKTSFANPEQEAKEFGGLLQERGFSDNPKVIDELRHQSNDPALESRLSELESLFETQFDSGKKGEDPLKSSLGKKNLEAAQQKNPNQPSLSETQNLLKQKQRFKISHDDPIFKKSKEIMEVELKDKEEFVEKERRDLPLPEPKDRIVTCRQSIKPEIKTCTKRLIVTVIPQLPIFKNVTVYKTVLQYAYNPCRCRACGSYSDPISITVPEVVQQAFPQKPLLKEHWEGCEDLEVRVLDGTCEKVEVTPEHLEEVRRFPGYPDPIQKPHWTEQQAFLCGAGQEIDECQTLLDQGCEQIDSKCAILKEGRCLEFENSFRCGVADYLRGESLVLDAATGALLKTKEQPSQGFDTQDFGEAITQFNVLTELSKKLEDDLGGISGDSSNPSVFHGQCSQCRINLGSFFRDCCKLKGILQGLFGHCSLDEKKLAIAAIKKKRCVKVEGRYCHNKKLGICLEKRESYCCYGSQLARIIQEIAHQQLGIPWGAAQTPHCGSLTAEQLSRLNFDSPYAQSKLSELFQEVQSSAQARFNAANEQMRLGGSLKEKVDSLSQSLQERFKAEGASLPSLFEPEKSVSGLIKRPSEISSEGPS